MHERNGVLGCVPLEVCTWVIGLFPSDGIKKEASINLRYGYLGTLNACDQWPIDLTLQNRFYFVFIAEFVEDCQQSFRSIYEVPTSLKLSTAGQND